MSNSFSGCCCKQCDPCCIPYGQSLESSCFGAEVEAIPQVLPSQEQLLSPKCASLILNKNSVKKNVIIPLIKLETRKMCKSMNLLPKTHISRKIKSDVLYSSWECCKRNGIQDETPQWLVLGRPYRRPGPSYRCRVAYYPTAYNYSNCY